MIDPPPRHGPVRRVPRPRCSPRSSRSTRCSSAPRCSRPPSPRSSTCRSATSSGASSCSSPRSSATVLVNALVLRRRFEPLERLIDTMERVDLRPTRARAPSLPAGDSVEVARLNRAFDRMLDRLEDERARTAGAVLRAQEERARAHRPRPARRGQPGAHRRRCCASRRPPRTRRRSCARSCARRRRLATQAMDELLRLARELRPAALDDHGLARRAAHAGRRVRRAAPASTPTSRSSRGALDGLDRRAADRRLPHRPGEPLERRRAMPMQRRCTSLVTREAGRDRRPRRRRRRAASRPSARSPRARTGSGHARARRARRRHAARALARRAPGRPSNSDCRETRMSTGS